MDTPPDASPESAAPPIDELSRIRHDLRTPASHILGYAEMLQEEAAERGLEDLAADLRRIEQSGRRLVQVIREELVPDRLTSGPAHVRHLLAELRTPLNHAIGYSEILIEAAEHSDGAAALLPDLRKIQQAAQTFLQRMGELLHPATLEALARSAHAARAAMVPTSASASSNTTVLAHAYEVSRASAAVPGMAHSLGGNILVVDDDASNRDLLGRRLAREGFGVREAAHGAAALEILRREPVDLVLLDLVMPGMNGDAVLREIKADPALATIPVIMLSALDEMDSVVRCLLTGAEDYLAKPVNPVLLRARMNACLERSRLRRHEAEYLRAIEVERHKSETLLRNVLPQPIADRLKRGETTIVDSLPSATVLFADLVGFTALSARLPTVELVGLLDEIFCAFDALAERQGLEKIKTIGDAYMVVGGLPDPRPDHVEAIAEVALDMMDYVERQLRDGRLPIQLRIGINTGPVIAGIIGRQKFNYDLWGDTVNVASRMESLGLPGRIQVTEATCGHLLEKYELESRGLIEVKGRGPMPTWFLTGRRT